MDTVPAQIFSALADARLMAASRCIPGVCGVLASSWSWRTIRTPNSAQSGKALVMTDSVDSQERVDGEVTGFTFLASGRILIADRSRQGRQWSNARQRRVRRMSAG